MTSSCRSSRSWTRSLTRRCAAARAPAARRPAPRAAARCAAAPPRTPPAPSGSRRSSAAAGRLGVERRAELLAAELDLAAGLLHALVGQEEPLLRRVSPVERRPLRGRGLGQLDRAPHASRRSSGSSRRRRSAGTRPGRTRAASRSWSSGAPRRQPSSSSVDPLSIVVRGRRSNSNAQSSAFATRRSVSMPRGAAARLEPRDRRLRRAGQLGQLALRQRPALLMTCSALRDPRPRPRARRRLRTRRRPLRIAAMLL